MTCMNAWVGLSTPSIQIHRIAGKFGREKLSKFALSEHLAEKSLANE